MTQVLAGLIATDCPLCGPAYTDTVLYPRNFEPSDLNITVFSARRLPDKIHYQVVKCDQCGLVRSNPVAESATLVNLYKQSHFTYQDEIESLTATYVESLQPVLAQVGKSAKILEIGCGNGFVLSELYHLGYQAVYGVEPSSDALKQADRSIKAHLTCDVLKPGLFPPRSFDCICFFQTLDHIPNPNAFLSECYRLLKPGGYIVAFNHNIDSWSARFFKEKSPIIDIEHTYLYSGATITQLFSRHKFKPVSLTYPANYLTLKHLLWLLPLPRPLKQTLIRSNLTLLQQQIRLKLGNLCLIAKK